MVKESRIINISVARAPSAGRDFPQHTVSSCFLLVNHSMGMFTISEKKVFIFSSSPDKGGKLTVIYYDIVMWSKQDQDHFL